MSTQTTKIFRFSGDALMFIARILLAKKVKTSKSVSGLSLKTHFIYLIVYLCRYVDLFWVQYTKTIRYNTVVNWLNIYNSCFKVFLITFQMLMCYLIGYKFRKSYYKRYDNFPLSVLLLFCAGISLILCDKTFFMVDFAYTLSLILESVAILPQLVMTQESEDCESMTSKYIFLLGLYRLNYLVYFLLQKLQGYKIDLLMVFTALIQTVLYVDFFKVYYEYMLSKSGSFKRSIKQ
ncbi:KdelR [Ecytonucleospora hepatopenaei]|uniref:ER lumen protein-retaining receptor n=1 Tax=Ecytonucleospora hepatopenaei TaxID=646526 RepID=A0A1W0E5A1_9MICR|nr:KdelR [Ecytonucleospora hepatopenaei]